MTVRILLDLATSDYLMLPATAKTLTTTAQRQQIMLSLLLLCLNREAWEPMSDSAWDAWEAGLSEMIEELQA